MLGFLLFLFFLKQKTAYEIYQCDWSSDVCSSDLIGHRPPRLGAKDVRLDAELVGSDDVVRVQKLDESPSGLSEPAVARGGQSSIHLFDVAHARIATCQPHGHLSGGVGR